MASLESALALVNELKEALEQKGLADIDEETVRRQALRQAQLLLSGLEKPEDVAFETAMQV